MQPWLPGTTASSSVLVQTPVLVLCCPLTGEGVVLGCTCLDITCGIGVLACFTQMSDHLMEKNSLVLNSLKLVLNTVIFMVVGPLVYLFQAGLIITEHSSGIAKAQSPQGLVP